MKQRKKPCARPPKWFLIEPGGNRPGEILLMPEPMRYKLEHDPLIIEQDVTRGDRGAQGHVNNVVYFRHMENARVECYRRIGTYEFEQGISDLQKRENPFPTSTSRGIHE